MYDFIISKEQARQFAYDCYDIIVQGIKEQETASHDCEKKRVCGEAPTPKPVFSNDADSYNCSEEGRCIA